MAARRLNILLVDDDGVVAEVIAATLRDHHAVLVAHDGATAMALALRLVPDVVLLDLGLPDLHGLEVARRLRHAGFRGRLLAVTGADLPLAQARAAGFDDVVSKPYDIDALLAVVGQARR